MASNARCKKYCDDKNFSHSEMNNGEIEVLVYKNTTHPKIERVAAILLQLNAIDFFKIRISE